jgi:DNA-3-methyladenine glycosylase
MEARARTIPFKNTDNSYVTVTAREVLELRAEVAAPQLLGWRLRSEIGGEQTEVALTEVEAYRSSDPASHSYGGPRGRNRIMFERPGYLYVYRSYGIHWCANVVCEPEGVGAAVLFRAGRPLLGLALMERRRGRQTNLTKGPGNLCSALGITGDHYGLDLLNADSVLRLLPDDPPARIVTTPRVGITKAVDLPWRFVAGA